ncbi:caspase family protein [Kribbella sp. NPDC050459]|uniref:caspase family protein n=1 Tax=Kribbella sp. NPDC050459 TaxID=3155785 RepID=UPI00340039F7
MGGLYALIIGVSAYPHLDGGTAPARRTYRMGQLSAAALTAHRIADWLEEADGRLAAPYRGCRLLLSPSPGELDVLTRQRDHLPATLEQMRAQALLWREEVCSDPDNVAFFYFAGHGVQRTRRDAVLLMEDFADSELGNPLAKAVDLQNLFRGMAPTAARPDMAMNQLWFVDACRGFPSEFDNFEILTAQEIFAIELSDVDLRNAPLYYGALPGTNAYSISQQSTIMGRALLECLQGGAGEKRAGSREWWVTTGTLLRGLQQLVEEEGTQEIWDGGQMPRPNTRIARVDGTPEVRVRMELSPARAANRISLAVHRTMDGAAMAVPSPLHPNPFEGRWPAGMYRLTCQPSNAAIPDEEWAVVPPLFPWKGELS